MCVARRSASSDPRIKREKIIRASCSGHVTKLFRARAFLPRNGTIFQQISLVLRLPPFVLDICKLECIWNIKSRGVGARLGITFTPGIQVTYSGNVIYVYTRRTYIRSRIHPSIHLRSRDVDKQSGSRSHVHCSSFFVFRLYRIRASLDAFFIHDACYPASNRFFPENSPEKGTTRVSRFCVRKPTNWPGQRGRVVATIDSAKGRRPNPKTPLPFFSRWRKFCPIDG